MVKINEILQLTWARKSGVIYRISPLRMLYIVTLTYIINVKVSGIHIILNILKTVRAGEKCPKYDFYRGLYLPSNGTIAIGVLRDIGLHFQGQTFSCYAFVIKKTRRQRIFPAYLPRLARPAPWSCPYSNNPITSYRSPIVLQLFIAATVQKQRYGSRSEYFVNHKQSKGRRVVNSGLRLYRCPWGRRVREGVCRVGVSPMETSSSTAKMIYRRFLLHNFILQNSKITLLKFDLEITSKISECQLPCTRCSWVTPFYSKCSKCCWFYRILLLEKFSNCD